MKALRSPQLQELPAIDGGPPKSTFCVTRGQKLGLLVTLGGLLLFSHGPDFIISYGSDYNVYVNNAYEIRGGKIPYRDFFDHKLPLFYYYLASLQELLGNAWISSKMILVITYLFSAAAFYLLSIKILMSREWSFLTSAAYYFFNTRLDIDPDRNGVIVVFGLTFVFLSLYFMFQFFDGNRKEHNMFISGIFSAFAFLSRQAFLEPLLVLSGLIIFLILGYGSTKKNAFTPIFLFLLGFFLLLMPSIVFLGLIAGWDNLYFCLIRYNLDYSRAFISWHHSLGSISTIFMKVIPIFLLLFLALGKTGLKRAFLKLKLDPSFIGKSNFQFLFLLFCLFSAIVVSLVTKARIAYYFLPAVAFMILITAFLLKDLGTKSITFPNIFRNNRGVTRLLSFSLVAFLLLDSYTLAKAYGGALKAFINTGATYENYPELQISSLARSILEKADGGGGMFVAGSRAMIISLSHAKSTYFTSIPLTRDDICLSPKRIVEEVVSSKPLLIVDWDYRDYFPDSTELETLVLHDYKKVASFSRSFNWPNKSHVDAVLYRRKN